MTKLTKFFFAALIICQIVQTEAAVGDENNVESNPPRHAVHRIVGKIIETVISNDQFFGKPQIPGGYDDSLVMVAIEKIAERYYRNLNFVDHSKESNSQRKRRLEGQKDKDFLNTNYIFFDLSENATSKTTKLTSSDGHARLDIQNYDAHNGTHVNIQLQIGKGQKPENCLASVNVKKGVYYSPQHIFYCLLKSYEDYQEKRGKTPKEYPLTIDTDYSNKEKRPIEKTN
ncbi:MAG: hypothetical protein WCG05_00280 [Alphaproteobacteria bacterium]